MVSRLLRAGSPMIPTETTPIPPLPVPKKDRVVCHCLRVTQSQIQTAIDVDHCSTLKEVMDCTRAGGGCTACHRRILDLLGQKPVSCTSDECNSKPCQAPACETSCETTCESNNETSCDTSHHGSVAGLVNLSRK